MKCIYPLAILALATTFSGCSSDDKDHPYVKGDTDSAITFSNPFINNSVKQRAATPTTKDNLEGFKVWGFVADPSSVVFDGANVTRNGSGWSISETEYWYLGQPYWFTAISTGEIETMEHYVFTPLPSGTKPSGDEGYLGGGSIFYNNSNAEGEEDLIYAFSKKVQHNTPESITQVPLTFNHLLSQVTFEFRNQMTQRTTLDIEGLTLLGAANSGDIDLSTGLESAQWVPSNEKFPIADISTEKFQYQQGTISEPSYIIPTDNSREYQIQFTAVVYNGNNEMARYSHLITLPKTTFLKGNSYKFIATLTPQNINPAQQLKPIEFTVVDVNTWQPNEDIIVPVTDSPIE